MAGIPASVAGTLIITLGRASRCQSASACSIVAWVSSARSGVHSNETNPSRPSARVVCRAQQVGGPPDVVERELEKELLRTTQPGCDGVAKLVVVAVRAGDGLGEDRGVRGRAGDRAVGDQRSRRRRSSSSSRESVSSQIETPASCSVWRRFMRRCPSGREQALRAGCRGRRGAGRRPATRSRMSRRIGSVDVPDVHVHARHDAVAGEPEGDELAGSRGRRGRRPGPRRGRSPSTPCRRRTGPRRSTAGGRRPPGWPSMLRAAAGPWWSALAQCSTRIRSP